MSAGRRYFILGDPLPGSQVPHMLGRVVEDKLLPLRSFVPFGFNDSNAKPDHNPENIIPGILPEPVVWSTRKDFFSNISEWSLGTGLADLIGIEQSFGTERGVTFEGDDVKSYSLPNTLQHFQRLMGNDAYARDVRDLLRRSKAGQAYFVTGFLTARQGTLSEFKLKSRKLGMEVTVPALEAAGVPTTILGGVGNPQIAPSASQTQRRGRTVEMVQEAIIAVSYDVIKSSRSFHLDSKKFLQTSIVNAGPKRAGSKHLAYSGTEDSDDSDEADNSGSETEDTADRYAEEEADEVTFVNTEIFANALYNEDLAVNAASASFRL